MATVGEFLHAWWIILVPIAFIALLFYAFNPKRKKEFQDDANIPFDDT